MNAKKSRSIKTHFILDELHQRQLDDIVAQVDFPRKFEAKTADGNILDCRDAETVIRQTSLNTQPIVELEVITPLDERPNVRIILRKVRDQEHPDTIYYSVVGTETEVPYLYGRLDEWIEELRPWYARLASIDIFFGLSSLFFAFSFLIMLLFGCAYLSLASRGIILPSASKPVDVSGAATIVGMVLAALIGMAALLGYARQRLFPVATFAIGHGQRRHQRILQLRRAFTIGLSVIFTLLCGLFVNWITRGW